MKQIEVVAAIINNKDEVLCVQRGINKLEYLSKKYEFPGGKIEQGETHREALKREIMEELHIPIEIEQKFITIEHDYPNFHLTMHAYECTVSSKDLTLTEHLDFKWLTIDKLKELDWAAADIPIVNNLVAHKKYNEI
jgi:8-oxo-dGTP diphosphatase